MNEIIEYANAKGRLIDLVLKQIQDDVDSGDLTALEELLVQLDDNVLKSYLPEETANGLE